MFLTKIENGELLLELRDYFYKKSKLSKKSFIERLPLRYQANKKYPKVEKYAIIFVEIYRRDGVFLYLKVLKSLKLRHVWLPYMDEIIKKLAFC